VPRRRALRDRERSIAYAYPPLDVELDTSVEIDLFRDRVPGVVTREPLYDPGSDPATRATREAKPPERPG